MPTQIQGPCLPPGSTELMPGTRSPSAAPFPQAVGRACLGLPVLSHCLPCPAPWQHLSTRSSIQGSSPAANGAAAAQGTHGLQACGRTRLRPRSALPLDISVLLLLPLPFLPGFCINPYLIQHTQIWNLFSGYKQGHLGIHSYTERVYKIKTLRSACKTQFPVISDQQMKKPKPVAIWHLSFCTGITISLFMI